jgi:hypothetical protein
MGNAIKSRGNVLPGFYFFRTVWVNPTTITDAVALLRGQHPELNCQVLAPRAFFSLFREFQQRQAKTTRGKRAPPALPALLEKINPTDRMLWLTTPFPRQQPEGPKRRRPGRAGCASGFGGAVTLPEKLAPGLGCGILFSQ